ncbi:MAG TPA: hypothetical protein PLX45_17785 [Piscinibacter sp.]|jgi:hypothetical protein|uniref:DUF6776 family protein n=1 Tax=Piscinibacter sp. TaxID=1903157 RepID=UPI001B4412BB|nr:DUF6776 family protein [Piscinibacter sp.]MBK7530475.1 hypothetical protein [Piscinibacter sp.]MBL0092823.1 hypothetical protein [Piscinibacter sp.]MBP6541271.1 hypothetical protein [Piscinibacter sp.]HNW61754.1 hypothetical protein [Piscinibacter sp.]HOY36140.1 hypothetical protein [Piscinibacter sp.]
MRWKLWRRRLSVSAPRMIVRSHLPWPLRWAVAALALGFSGALAMWAFETGKNIAGLDRDAKEELSRLRVEVAQLRDEREKALSIANTADSLLKTERTAQERLAQQLKQTEAENLALKNDLGFFERLLPAAAGESALSIRGLQAEAVTPGQLRYQLLLMQTGKSRPEFSGRYEMTLSGTLEGRPWSLVPPGGTQPLQVRQYRRVEGLIDHPPQAVIKMVTVKVTDTRGAVLASHTLKM